MKQYKVKVFWGRHQCGLVQYMTDEEQKNIPDTEYDIQTYSFDTQSERSAFLKGIDECMDWSDAITVNID